MCLIKQKGFLRKGGHLVEEREEHELLWEAKSGNRPAMDELIQRHYHSIFAYFYKNTGNYEQSKDLTQEVFIKAAANIEKYHPWRGFSCWLFAIASNHLKNYWRSLTSKPETEELPENIPSGEDMESRIVTHAAVSQAMASLPAEQRETIILRFYEEFSVPEIARITKARESTVKGRLRYGLAKLRKILEDSP